MYNLDTDCFYSALNKFCETVINNCISVYSNESIFPNSTKIFMTVEKIFVKISNKEFIENGSSFVNPIDNGKYTFINYQWYFCEQ